MKKNGMTTILNWALMAGAVALVICGFKYYNKTKTVRQYQALIAQFNGLQNNENIVRALVGDSLEYAKTNRAIQPVLDTIVGKPGKGTPPPTGSGKPASK